MRKVIFIATSLFSVFAAARNAAAADLTREYSVQLSASVQTAPAEITLHWPQDQCSSPKSYTVYRKSPDDSSWGKGTPLSGSATSFADHHVSLGKAYEYQVVKNTRHYTGYGYIRAGINVPMVDSRGKLLLVVDNTYADSLQNEIATLQQDLVGDGWSVVRLDVGRNDSVPYVKSLIKAQYQADPANVKALFLLGHVPVPYSGDIVPDGHAPDHQGAWPCDGFYGDMQGVWTDSFVDDTRSISPRNRNVPGDGKFDQNSFPAPIKLMVGRVDLSNLPGASWVGGPPSFPSELELLRNYLHKDHNFRTGKLGAPRRALVGDFFGRRDGEAFAASAWRNFAPLFGRNVSSSPEGAWTSNLSSNNYLFAYGCGPGSFVTIGGLGNCDSDHDASTREIYTNDIKAVFALLYGSWLGDWDCEDDIMRSILALPDYGLASAWSGRPHWFIHPMALGEPIGYTARLTQNNGPSGLYQNDVNSCAGQIHIALMGDPTLRLHVVAPPSRLSAITNGSALTLSWQPSDDCSLVGYHVYRSDNPAGPFTRLTSTPVGATNYTDLAASGSANYMVRAVKLESSPSGTYFNPSQGAFLAHVGSAMVPVLTETGQTPAPQKVTPAQPARHANASSKAPVLAPTGVSTVINSWVDDSLPAGAHSDSGGGDTWNWISSNPTPYSGTLAHQSAIASGVHQQFFTGATQGLTVNAGDVLFAWVYVDPNNPPSELMLQWNDGTSWEHRAYWGANDIAWGAAGTAGCLYAGPMPTSGKWVQLQIPASQVGLEGATLTGMAFTLYNGRATWDLAGSISTVVTNPGGTTDGSGSNTNSSSGSTSGGGTNNGGSNSGNGSNSINSWIDDSLPTGAHPDSGGGDTWNWISSNPTPYSGTLAHQSAIASGVHQQFFTGATQGLTVNTGDVLFAWVYVDPNNPPSELMLQWNDGSSWEHRAYWGANDIAWGAAGTAGNRYAGPMPTAGQWAQLQIPASQVGLEGATLSGMAFTLYNGRATWDLAGSISSVVTNSGGSTSGSGTNTNSSSGSNSGSGSNTNSSGSTSGSGTNNDLSGGSTSGSGTNSDTSGGSNSGSSSSGLTATNSGVSLIDYTTLELPNVGDNTLHVLTPSLLELKLINAKQLDPAQVANWNFINSSFGASLPGPGAFTVTVNGQPVAVTSVNFKRRPLYAPLENYDLRIENSIYLTLASPVADNQNVQVLNPDASLWPSSMQFTATVDPLRYSPAIHVNQEGYLPNAIKQAMVGYYAGSLGEMPIPTSTGFQLVDANTGAQVYQGSLVLRPDSGWSYTPAPYQQVYEADFSSFTTPGEYRLVVPGMGASLPFLIDNGIAMSFARAYALGLYHQRCGMATAMPYTRFDHGICHSAPASVPSSAAAWPFTWTTISNYAMIQNPDNPVQTAPRLTSPAAQLFPYVNQGTVDVSGGHHDAGDYSKYTENSANLVHLLMFAVDSLRGVAAIDNMGIPESGDGISDLLQEAKWEADFIAKMQDADGGFYFLVYPQNREYEAGVTPDHGDLQVVWPKTTSVTAASVAALAQCASSPAFKKAYPAAAAMYLQKATLGWQFLVKALGTYGQTGAYQKITHYGDDFADQDELAWAACQMFLATGDQTIHQKLLSWFDPSNPATWRWGWWHMSECYGHCIRSYAFAVQSGRVASTSQLDPTFLAKCQAEIAAAGDAMLSWSQQSAYGTSFPSPTKAVQSAGWYFSASQAFDIAVAYQLNPKPAYMTAMLANMNYEGGVNPVNVCYVTGLGWKRQRDIVSQWHSVDYHVLPPSGIPVGNVEAIFPYDYMYGTELEELCYPSDNATTAPYPFYDRWGDSWNVTAEFTVQDAARGIGTLAFLAAQTAAATQPWQAPSNAQINVPTTTVPVGSPVTVTLQVPGIDLSGARITWEARDQQPTFGQSFTFSPKNGGAQWVEAEAQFSDGRRIFAKASFNANSPNLVWVDDAVPTGATAGADGGDTWNWVSSNPSPNSGLLSSQSAIASGEHQHFFINATTTLQVGTGDVLYAYIYIDPANVPSEILVQWNDGTSWEHRAYWGADKIAWGTPGTAGQQFMGPIPVAGQWVQLQVPASKVGLEGSTLSGLGLTLYGGRASWDTIGRLSTATNTPTGAVKVTVSTAANASRVGPQPGSFTVTRSGDTSTALPVSFSLGGSAINGTDYQSPQTNQSSVTIPAGSNSAIVSITPVPTTNVAASQTIVLNVASSSAYSVGTPASATIILEGNTVPVGGLQVTKAGATLTWPSVSNAVYQVRCKTNLTDPSWMPIGPPINASGSGPSFWIDASAANSRSRFYIVTRLQ